jgi:hypothetical protein
MEQQKQVDLRDVKLAAIEALRNAENIIANLCGEIARLLKEVDELKAKVK